jgi:hypothetical protein
MEEFLEAVFSMQSVAAAAATTGIPENRPFSTGSQFV